MRDKRSLSWAETPCVSSGSASLLLLSFPPNAFASFSDVNQNTTFEEAILYAQENEIVKGYSDGTFKPEIEINRAEFTKIIIAAVFDESEIIGEDCFPDVQKEWFAKYICTAKEEGIINGYDDGLFRPENNISFVEAAKIISLGLGYETENDSTVWYRPFLEMLSDKKSIPTTITDINKKITRGEMVEIIYRLKENIQSETSMEYTNDTLTIGEEEVSENWYKPKPGASWQWQLSEEINTSYDVDMYDIDLVETPQSVIDELHSKGEKVICYFSAGSWEEFRDDANDFPEEVLGETLEGWADEKWLDVSNYQKFSDIMEARLDLAVEKNCDGVEPDNMDGYSNDNGFDLSYEDQVVYSKWIADESHKRNLSVGLKNGLEQVEDVIDYFDFAVNEQCFEYEECEELLPFIEEEKAVFGVEYELETSEFCEEANEMLFSWLKMDYDLNGGRISCDQ